MRKLSMLILLAAMALLRVTTADAAAFTIPAGVTVIEAEAFYGDTGLDEVIFPEGLKIIGKKAFAQSSVRRVYLPASLTDIADDAFPDGTVGYGMDGTAAAEYFKTHDGLTFRRKYEELPASDFRFSKIDEQTCRLTGYTGPEGEIDLVIPSHDGAGRTVVEIGRGAFYKKSEIKGALVIPDSVTAIGAYAFYDCSGLTGDLVIPNSVTSMGEFAFYHCGGFAGELTIGNSVTEIGEYTFSRCAGLTGSLVIPDSVTSIGKYAFYHCGGFTGDLTIGNGVTAIGEFAFADCSGFTGGLAIGNSVTTIDAYAFNRCSGLTGNLRLPGRMRTIGEYAFSRCSGLTGNVLIPDSVTSMGAYAFFNCSGFTGELTIGNGVSAIEEYTFYGQIDLEQVILPDGLERVGSRAFGGTGIWSVRLPESLNQIADDAFPYGAKGYGKDGTFAAQFFKTHNGLSFSKERPSKPVYLYAMPLPLPALTGNAQEDFLAVAHSQIGYHEAEDQSSYFAAWYNKAWPTAEWCSEFVSWCAETAGISTDVIPKAAGSAAFQRFFMNAGRFYFLNEGIKIENEVLGYYQGLDYCQPSQVGKISFTAAEPGDILLQETNLNYTDGADHTAIFLSYDGEYVTTLSGNYNNQVGIAKKRPNIFYGICKPDFGAQ